LSDVVPKNGMRNNILYRLVDLGIGAVALYFMYDIVKTVLAS
jgi:hypothetical protein